MRKLILSITIAVCLPSCVYYVDQDARRTPPPACHGARSGHAGVIGLALGERLRPDGDPVLVVDRVAPGGPAALADILPGDRISAIDGESTRGMTVGEAARLIRGPAGTAVELRVSSPRGPRLITLVRVPPREVLGRRAHSRERARRNQPWPPTKPGHAGP